MTLLFCSSFLLYWSLLLLLPLSWKILYPLHFCLSLFSAWAVSRKGKHSLALLNLRSIAWYRVEWMPLNWSLFVRQSLSFIFALAPVFYLASFFQELIQLQSLSVRLPAGVFVKGLLWMGFSLIPSLLLAWLFTKSGLKLCLRNMVFLYIGVLALFFWILFWEILDTQIFNLLDASDMPRLMSYHLEDIYTDWLQWTFYGLGCAIGLIYLSSAQSSGAFLRRLIAIGFPTFLLFVNLRYYQGHWDSSLAAIRDAALRRSDIKIYQILANLQLARSLPAFESPYVLNQLADMDFALGKSQLAREKWTQARDLSRIKPYYAELFTEVNSLLEHWMLWDLAHPKGKLTKHDSLFISLPLIKPALYLNPDWYSLLSAYAYYHPELSDIEVKKKLLDVSTQLHLQLPSIGNVPDWIPILNQLELPHSLGFLNVDKIQAALAHDKVPFIYWHGRWIPIMAWDERTNSFYFYQYPSSRPSPLKVFQQVENGLFYQGAGKNSNGDESQSLNRLAILKRISKNDLDQYIRNIGGVGLIVGDSTFTNSNESRAAFFVELGDDCYQSRDDFIGAAKNYQLAYSLWNDPQIRYRQFYLIRRYAQKHLDPRSYTQLYDWKPNPSWIQEFAIDSLEQQQLLDSLYTGKMGSYVMQSWFPFLPLSTMPDGRRKNIDSTIELKRALLQLEPYNNEVLDSLAALYFENKMYDSSLVYLNHLEALSVTNNEEIHFKKMWMNYKLALWDSLPHDLESCPTFRYSIEYQIVHAELSFRKGNSAKALDEIKEALKQNRIQPDAHDLAARIYLKEGDTVQNQLHERWLRRSSLEFQGEHGEEASYAR